MHSVLVTNKAKNQAGFSLVSFLLAVALSITLISTVTFTLFHTTTKDTKLITAENDLSSIVTAARAWKKSQPDYSAISLNVLCSEGLLNTSFCKSPYDPWGGQYSIAVASGKPYQFTITVSNCTQASAFGNMIKAGTENSNVVVTGSNVLATYE